MKNSKGKFSIKKLNPKKKINIKNIISNIKEKRTQNKKILRNGSYSIGITAVVIAIVVVFNLVVQELPSNLREIDLSSEKLYTIGDQTKEVLDNLDKDVEMYLIAQDGTESSDIQRLLERYEDRSSHVTVEQRDPAVYPTFTQQYTSDSVNNNSVNIMTIHSAKGLEFDTVFLPGWEEGIFPSPKSVDERNGLEEERRLAYVAITRAKKKLFISYSKTRFDYNELRITQPSRFIKELPEENLNIISKDIFREEYKNEDEEYENQRVGRYNNYYTPKNSSYSFDDDGEPVIQRNEEFTMKNVAKRVMHPTFGEGVVIKTDGKKLTIAFKTCGVKTIIQDFVKFI